MVATFSVIGKVENGVESIAITRRKERGVLSESQKYQYIQRNIA